jgi:DNA-binding response OmpR family regulator
MLSPTQRAMVAFLRPGHIVPTETLVDAIYGSRRDGGPDGAAHAVRTQIYKMRAKLAAIGVEIETVGHGRGSDGYRLKNADALDTVW